VALACAFQDTGSKEIIMRGHEQDITLLPLEAEGNGTTLEWNVTEHGNIDGKKVFTVHCKAGLSVRIVQPEELKGIKIPEVPEDGVVIISTAGPHWLRASIALGYKDKVAAVAAFTPGEGSTIAWAKDKKLLGEVIE
jgi:hypothetical protein